MHLLRAEKAGPASVADVLYRGAATPVDIYGRRDPKAFASMHEVALYARNRICCNKTLLNNAMRDLPTSLTNQRARYSLWYSRQAQSFHRHAFTVSSKWGIHFMQAAVRSSSVSRHCTALCI